MPAHSPFTPEQRAWLASEIPSGTPCSQIARDFSERFGRRVFPQAVRRYAERNGIEPGWPKRRPAGSGSPARRNRRRYERERGPVPDGCRVVAVGPDVEAVPVELLAQLSLRGVWWTDRETFEVCVLLAGVWREMRRVRERDPEVDRMVRNAWAAASRERRRKRDD